MPGLEASCRVGVRVSSTYCHWSIRAVSRTILFGGVEITLEVWQPIQELEL